jgi:DNA polymerase type B, organellar and viral
MSAVFCAYSKFWKECSDYKTAYEKRNAFVNNILTTNSKFEFIPMKKALVELIFTDTYPTNDNLKRLCQCTKSAIEFYSTSGRLLHRSSDEDSTHSIRLVVDEESSEIYSIVGDRDFTGKKRKKTDSFWDFNNRCKKLGNFRLCSRFISDSMFIPAKCPDVLIMLFYDLESTIQTTDNMTTVMCSMMIKCDAKMLITITEKIRRNIETYFCDVAERCAERCGFTRFKDAFQVRSEISEINECFIHISDRYNQKSSDSAKIYADFQCELLKTLEFCHYPNGIDFSIKILSTGFNNKKYDEIFVGKYRLHNHEFKRAKIMQKGRISSWTLRTSSYMYNRTIKFGVCDMFDFFPGSLESACKSSNLRYKKGSAPLLKLIDYYSFLCDKNSWPKIRDYWDKHVEGADAEKNQREEFEKLMAPWKLRGSYDLLEDVALYCCMDTFCVAQLYEKLEEAMRDMSENWNVTFNHLRCSSIPALSFYLWLSFRSAMGKDKNTLPHAPQGEALEMIQKSYYGGRVEQRYQGEIDLSNPDCPYTKYGEKFVLIDVTSLYPLAMTAPFQWGRIKWMSDSDLKEINRIFSENFGNRIRVDEMIPFNAIVECEWPHPNPERDPNFPLYASSPRKGLIHRDIMHFPKNRIDREKIRDKLGPRIIWDNAKTTTVMDNFTAITRHNDGWKVSILPYRDNIVHETVRPAIRFFIDIMKFMKENNPDGSAKRNYGKLFLNGIYGFFAMNPNAVHYSISEDLADVKRKSESGEIDVLSVSAERSDVYGANIPTYITKYKSSRKKAVNQQPYQLGQNTTAFANKIMVEHYLRVADVQRGCRPIDQRLPMSVYTDTDSMYCTESVAKQFDKYMSSKIGHYNFETDKFDHTCKIEKENITNLILIAPKLMSSSINRKKSTIKAKGHCKNKRDAFLDIAIDENDLRNLVIDPEKSISSRRRTLAKNLLNVQGKRKALDVNFRVLTRRLRVPPICFQATSQVDENVVLPYHRPGVEEYLFTDLPEQFLSKFTSCGKNGHTIDHLRCRNWPRKCRRFVVEEGARCDITLPTGIGRASNWFDRSSWNVRCGGSVLEWKNECDRIIRGSGSIYICRLARSSRISISTNLRFSIGSERVLRWFNISVKDTKSRTDSKKSKTIQSGGHETGSEFERSVFFRAYRRSNELSTCDKSGLGTVHQYLASIQKGVLRNDSANVLCKKQPEHSNKREVHDRIRIEKRPGRANVVDASARRQRHGQPLRSILKSRTRSRKNHNIEKKRVRFSIPSVNRNAARENELRNLLNMNW